MPQQQPRKENEQTQTQTQNELLTNVNRGNSVEIRATTLLHGWLKDCQRAQRAGPAEFSRWIGQQTNMIDQYASAVTRANVGTQNAATTEGNQG